MRFLATIGLALLTGLALVCVFMPGVSAQSPSQDVIKACVQLPSGLVRIVPPTQGCGFRETPVFWNIAGRDGKDGVDGKDGANGKDGTNGVNGENGEDGRDGRDGRDGQDCTGGGTPPPAGPIGEIKIDDIHAPDESSPILSATGGVTVPPAGGGGGGGGAGKPDIQDMVVVKHVDEASPKEFMAAVTGEHIRRVDISVFRPGTTDVEVFYRLEDAIIGSVQHSGGGGSVLTESISFSFGKISGEFKPEKGGSIPFCFDVKRNQKC